jgi:hypothetical protein
MMERPTVVTSDVLEIGNKHNPPKPSKGESSYGETPGEFDELTVMAWEQSKFCPYSAEYFKIINPSGEILKDLQRIDKWVINELKGTNEKPTISNYKKMLKQLSAEEGIKTYQDFIESKLTPKEEIPLVIPNKKSSDFVGFLKSLVKILE